MPLVTQSQPVPPWAIASMDALYDGGDDVDDRFAAAALVPGPGPAAVGGRTRAGPFLARRALMLSSWAIRSS